MPRDRGKIMQTPGGTVASRLHQRTDDGCANCWRTSADAIVRYSSLRPPANAFAVAVASNHDRRLATASSIAADPERVDSR